MGEAKVNFFIPGQTLANSTVFQITWHVPNAAEIDFALEIFREVVEPALDTLEHLLEPGKSYFPSNNGICLSRHPQATQLMQSGVTTFAGDTRTYLPFAVYHSTDPFLDI